MAAELPSTEQIFTETSRLVPLLYHSLLADLAACSFLAGLLWRLTFD